MYETYCRIRDKKGLKDSNVADAAKIPRSTFTDWKQGKSSPKREKMEKIANVLDVPVDYLMTGDAKYLAMAYAKQTEATIEELEIINAFRKADELTQQMILRLLGLDQDSDSLSSKEA